MLFIWYSRFPEIEVLAQIRRAWRSHDDGCHLGSVMNDR
jgi:hypothetical protein